MIFACDTLELRLRSVLPTMLCALLSYCVADAAGRLLYQPETFGGWDSPDVQLKLDQAREAAAKRGRVDVLVLSSSIGRCIDTGCWQEAAQSRLVCYNAGMLGQRPHWQRFIFEKVLFAVARPAHVLLCITPLDVNGSNLPAASMRYLNPVWRSPAVRQLRAEGYGEKTELLLESMSHLFRVRHHARHDLQSGTTAHMLVPTDPDSGTELPNARRLPTADRKFVQLYAKGQPFASFSMPEDGEMADIVELARFCKTNGVGFTLVSHPLSPMAFEVFKGMEEARRKYEAGIARIRDAGIDVCDVGAGMQLRNECFCDPIHTNRRGAQKVTDYLYERVVQPRFLDRAPARRMPEPIEVPLCTRVSHELPGVALENRSLPLADWPDYAADLQVVTSATGTRMAVHDALAPGRYLVDLYGADKLPAAEPHICGYALFGATARSIMPRHLLRLELEKPGQDIQACEFRTARVLVRGNTLTRVPLDVSTTSSLWLNVARIDGPECVLDTVFLTPLEQPLAGRP